MFSKLKRKSELAHTYKYSQSVVEIKKPHRYISYGEQHAAEKNSIQKALFFVETYLSRTNASEVGSESSKRGREEPPPGTSTAGEGRRG